MRRVRKERTSPEKRIRQRSTVGNSPNSRMRSPKSCNRLVDFAGCLTGCDADTLASPAEAYSRWSAGACPVVAVAFTAPATANAATFLALLSPAVTVLAPLAHDGDKDDLGLLAGGGEALVEWFEGGVVMPGAEGRHLEDISHSHVGRACDRERAPRPGSRLTMGRSLPRVPSG